MSETGWGGCVMGDIGELPTGTVTLLLADIEGSTRLWETQPQTMRPAVERLDQVLAETVAAHHGVRPVEQGEGDSFVVAFARAGDAVMCALELQRAPLEPIKLRIGLHTGDVQLRDEGNYIGPTINRAARLRDLGHGGQTVLSGAIEPLVVDHLPDGVTLIDLGTHPLRDLPRPERVIQLCHPDLRTDFPPLRTTDVIAAERIPIRLTSFIGRHAEMAGIREALDVHRLVTLTGAGGAGKTRLAIEVAAATAFPDGVCFVDLAPITQPELVPVTAERALGLPGQSGRPAMEVLRRYLRERETLILLDNCEHLLDASAELITTLLMDCPAVTFLATSREPIGVAGEVAWRVPSLSLADEAVELFVDRARRVRPDFRIDEHNLETVTDICRRLDGLPLAIELAAARLRALSPMEIRDSLNDTFRLLTGGVRTAVRRQQTLRASVDWSHALLSDAEQGLFRRLAVFLGGFDLAAANAVAAEQMGRYQVLDQLTLLVDKSLLVAEESRQGTRYRMLDTVRQYAMEKLGESREAAAVRDRHRDHFTAAATVLDDCAGAERERRIEALDNEIDNLRAAFAWSSDGDIAAAQLLAAALLPVWLTRGRIQEGLDWLAAVLADDVSSASPTGVRAAVCRAQLLSFLGRAEVLEQAEQSLVLAREHGDPILVTRALMACGLIGASADPATAADRFTEAATLAAENGDLFSIGQLHASQAVSGLLVGEAVGPLAVHAEEGLRIAEAIGDRFLKRQCRMILAWIHMFRGDMPASIAALGAVIDEATAANDGMYATYCRVLRAFGYAYAGDSISACADGEAALRYASLLFDYYAGPVHAAYGMAHLAGGDGPSARREFDRALACSGFDPEITSTYAWAALAPLACGDRDTATRWADEMVTANVGCGRAMALAARARVAIARGDTEFAERDLHDALMAVERTRAYHPVPFALDCLALVSAADGDWVSAARWIGAAESALERMGMARFAVLADEDQRLHDAVRESLGQNDFDVAYAGGEAMSIDEVISHALRGRGERRRAATGWAALTRAERDVVRLVGEGLANKDIAGRLFVSPRTVQAHLTHIYAKLGLTSRVQLAQEAARRCTDTHARADMD